MIYREVTKVNLDLFNAIHPEGNDEEWDGDSDEWQDAMNLLEGAQEVMEKVLRSRKLGKVFPAKLYKELEDQAQEISAFNQMMIDDETNISKDSSESALCALNL